MPLSIKDPEADRLARKLADETGESITEAVKHSLQERWDRVQRDRHRAGLAKRLLDIGRRCAEHMEEPVTSLDHGELLYDERGLPR
jgi:antitoxin VapB